MLRYRLKIVTPDSTIFLGVFLCHFNLGVVSPPTKFILALPYPSLRTQGSNQNIFSSNVYTTFMP